MADDNTIKASNPLDTEQVLDLGGKRYVIPPHGKADIPARYRPAIWHRRCDEQVCRDAGLPFCVKGHRSGIVIGGMAPQLIEEAT